MAHCAVRGESRLDVIGILSRVEILGMTTDAIGVGTLIFPVAMAGRAVQRGVHSGKSEACEFRVIEYRAQPAIHRVALFARDRE